MRLQKFLARSGVASRRGSEDLMTAGRVQVNGLVVTELGASVDPDVDQVTVDGKPVAPAGAPVYLVLHKPAGFVTTMSDPHGRPTVVSLVPADEHPGLFPVGRLDLDTTGLLLFTTDGELSHRLLHPKWKVGKVYVAEVDGVISEQDVGRLRSGVELDDGLTAPAEADVMERRLATSVVRITLSEGRKRQVKRMLSAVGHPVLHLHRTAFGPVELGGLPEGIVRSLTSDEVRALRQATGMDEEWS